MPGIKPTLLIHDGLPRLLSLRYGFSSSRIKTFDNRGTAIRDIQEMIRVAKAGVKIVMVDDNDQTDGSFDLASEYQTLAGRLSGCSVLSTQRDLITCKSGFRN